MARAGQLAGSRTIMWPTAPDVHLGRTGSVEWRRSRSRRDAVGALDRFRETKHHSSLVVRGAHFSPNRAGAKIFGFPRIKPRLGVVALVLVAAGCSRAPACVAGLVRGRGGGDHVRVDSGVASRAAGRRVRSRPGEGVRASQRRTRRPTISREIPVTRSQVATLRNAHWHTRSPVPLQHAHAM